MTSYHGGKQKIGKRIAQVIYNSSKIKDIPIKGYCEPFAGMLGVYRHIPVFFKDHRPKLSYKAGDANSSVILMWNAVKRGWKPPISITKTEYEKLRYDGKNSAKKGFIGHQYSFGGQYFQGMSTKKKSYPSAVKRITEIGKEIKKNNVKFSSGNYTQFSRLKNHIIYCDPPYSKFNQYYDDNHKRIPFNHAHFWDWCRKMSKHNIVFISEYSAPKDFVNIFTTKHASHVKEHTIKKREKLYVQSS